MVGNLRHKPATRRDAADHVRLKAAGDPAHINLDEARLLERLMPEAAGPVVTKGLLAEAGRRGDTAVTKLTPAEQRLLKAHGGSGTRNPATGLLEFGDGMGGSDNPGGGHNADSGPGSPGGGTSSPGGGTSSPGGGTSSPGGGNYSDRAGVGFGFSNAPASPGLSYGAISNFGGIGRGMSVDPDGNVSFSGRPGDLTNIGLAAEYAPLDTVKRLLQTAIFGPPKQYNLEQRPGAIPTRDNMGLARRAAVTMAGPAGPMMSGMMTVGGWMRDSMSPEAQEKSMAESQATGAKNSTGTDPNMSAVATPGTQSGAETAKLTPPPGYTLNPAGQLIPLPGGGKSTTLPQPVQNLLMDYIWRGRQGGGFRW